MKAWQFIAAHEPLKLIDAPEPQPAADEVIVEPRFTGLCHSDVGYMDGTVTSSLGFTPIILGHEIAGVVSAVGSNVSEFAVGDRVAIRAGIDSPGVASDGGYALKVAAKTEFVARIPDGLSFEYAAVATDAGMTSYHAVAVVGEAAPGMKVGIIGLGGLGYFGAQVAKAKGAHVYAADPNEAARAAAEKFGYTKIAKDITEFADDELDLIVDFAGFGVTTAGAVNVVKPKGRVVQVGLGRAEMTLPTLTFVVKQVQLLGSLAGDRDDLVAMMDLLEQGKIEPLVSTISFDEIPEGLERLHRGEVRGRLAAAINE